MLTNVMLINKKYVVAQYHSSKNIESQIEKYKLRQKKGHKEKAMDGSYFL